MSCTHDYVNKNREENEWRCQFCFQEFKPVTKVPIEEEGNDTFCEFCRCWSKNGCCCSCHKPKKPLPECEGKCPQPDWDESPSDEKHHFNSKGICIHCGKSGPAKQRGEEGKQPFSDWLSRHPCDTDTLWKIQNCIGATLGWDHPLHKEASKEWSEAKETRCILCGNYL